MDGRVTAAILSLVLSGFLVVAACAGAAAAGSADSTITIAGNQHIEADTIRSYFHAGSDGRIGANELDAGLKRLYATGLFKDVKIVRDGDRVLVIVAENPTIGRIAFEGNKRIKDADLKKAVQSREGGPLSRPFVQSDVERMIELYRQQGYFQPHIDPKTIETKNARVNLVFEIKEGDKLAVRQVLFAGNTAYSETKLKGVIKTGVTNYFSLLLNNDIYDADQIESDRDLVRRFYLAHGYADVRVVASAHYQADKKGVVLTFTLEEGPQYRLGKVDIQSSLKTVDSSALRRFLRTEPGDFYDADAVQKTVDDLTIEIAKSGEPFANVTARSERLAARRLINLVYAIEPGKRLYVERIDIHGNTRTRDEVIRREFDFNEGDAYNRALVDRGERRLKQLGYFKSVKIDAQPGSAPDRVIVNVAVQEQDTGTFAFSGGYSASDGMMGQVSIGDRNFMGTGDIAKASLTYGQYSRSFDLSFTDPYFLGQRIAVGGELFGKQTFANTYQAFDSTLYGAKVFVTTPLSEQLSATWNYSIYNQGLSLDPAIGTASLPIQQAAQAGSMWVSSIGNGLTYSTLDNAKDPTSGVRAQITNDFAGLGGAAKFARTTDDVRYYHVIAGDVVGMVRGQSGYIAPWGGRQLPLINGFFGGPQLVRGFAPNGFGPRDITPGTTMDNVGGNVYWATSAELQSPMPLVSPDAKLKVALFSDTGSLWATKASSVSSLSQSQQITNSHGLRSSIGAGLEWDSMFGPIRVDYAYPIAKQSNDITQRLQFTAGGFGGY